MRKHWLARCLVLVVIAGLSFQIVQANQSPLHTLIPIGSDYRQDTLERFTLAADQRDTNGIVDLLIMPITYGTDAYSTTNGERQKNLTLADNRRSQVDVNTGIEFTATDATVSGMNTVVVFDGRFASYALGTNGALSERYVILDTYMEGDALMP